MIVYSQNDPRWAREKLGFSSATIGGYGCVITTYSMLATYWGHPITPREFNDAMKRRNLYTGATRNLYTMNAITKIFKDITYRGYTDTPKPLTSQQESSIRRELDANRPVVLKVKTSIYHYVLAISYDEQGFVIADPIDGRIRTLRSRYGKDKYAIYRYVFHTGKFNLDNQIMKLDFSEGPILADTKGKYNASIHYVDIVAQDKDKVTIRTYWGDGTKFEKKVPLNEITIINRSQKKIQEQLKRVQDEANKLKAECKTLRIEKRAASDRATKLDIDNQNLEAEVRRLKLASKNLMVRNTECEKANKEIEASNRKLTLQVIDYSDTIKKERLEAKKIQEHLEKELKKIKNEGNTEKNTEKNVARIILNFILNLIKK